MRGSSPIMIGAVLLLAVNASSFARAIDSPETQPWIYWSEDDWNFDENLAQTQPPTTPTPPPPPAPPAPQVPPPAPETGEPEAEPPVGEEEGFEDEMSLGDIPVVETVELTPEIARKALDVYVLVREKYQDAELENYENLQDFVDQNPLGKAFEADVKAGGFANVTEWNTAVTTISFAYSNIIHDQTEDIKQQIEEIRSNMDLAQDLRDKMIAALQAMIPSENNSKITRELMEDPAYKDKVSLLETEEE